MLSWSEYVSFSVVFCACVLGISSYVCLVCVCVRYGTCCEVQDGACVVLTFGFPLGLDVMYVCMYVCMYIYP
jgi:hypothetical protein